MLAKAAIFLILLAWTAFAADRDQVTVIPHTHWEGAVFKTREEYLKIGLPNILKALRLLQQYPDYRFVLDQMCYVKPFLERYPNEAATLRAMIDSRHLEIAGGTDTMHDNNVPSGESIARQYLLAKHFFRDALGADVKTGWGLDTFGHNAQMPQILKLAGMDSYWFQRGVPRADTPAEFLWKGIDGTEIPAFWLPLGYGALYDTPGDLPRFEGTLRSLYDALTPFAHGYGRVFMAGADVAEPEGHLPPLLDQAQRSASLPFDVRFGLPSDYQKLIAERRPDRPVIAGELNPVFQGVYSNRIEVKQWMRDMERLLTSAEKASVLANRLAAGDREALDEAWEPVLFNQAHDLSSGVMLDKVYEDSLDRYRHAKHLGDRILEDRLRDVIATINTQGPGTPVVVFNLLGWPRSDFVDSEIGITQPNVMNLAVLDSSGKRIPSQLTAARRDEHGAILSATVAFIARDVPAMGYAVYHVVDASQAPAAVDSPAPRGNSANSDRDDEGVLENEFYRASFDLWTGEMKSLLLKSNQWQVLSAPGNIVAREPDGGDFWELYGTLNGARFTAMTRKIGPPKPAAQFSNESVGGNGAVNAGPVFSEFHVSHPFGKGLYATRVRMYPGIERIDIHTEILNNDANVRYRLMFPIALANGRNMQEIAFGSIERPSNQEFPAQNWIDYGDAGRGVALLNHGLPGSNIAGNVMLLSLMRSAHLISYGSIGGFEQGTSSDTGLELGKRLGFDYALVPHAGTWQDARVYRAGLDFNNPLLARAASLHEGHLPRRWGMLEISASHVVLSALKPSFDGDVAVRVYEAAGEPARNVRIRFAIPIASARAANLIEDPAADVPVRDNTITFNLRPYEIRTFRVRFRNPGN